MQYSVSNHTMTDNERKLHELCKQARSAFRELDQKSVSQGKWLSDFEKYTDELSEKAIRNGLEIDSE